MNTSGNARPASLPRMVSRLWHTLKLTHQCFRRSCQQTQSGWRNYGIATIQKMSQSAYSLDAALTAAAATSGMTTSRMAATSAEHCLEVTETANAELTR